MTRQSEKDQRDGYSLAMQDRRTLLTGFEREPEAKRRIAQAHDLPAAFLIGYNRGWVESAPNIRFRARKVHKKGGRRLAA